MRKSMALLLALSLCAAAGCATSKKGESAGFVERYSASRRLAQAVEMLAKGDPTRAAKELNSICNGNGAPGVTDEALFRLALLSLKTGPEKPAFGQGHQLLKRLRKEYPNSPWTAQAAPLIELMHLAEQLGQQNKSLKAANQSLTREVNELSKNIEQLKRLDLELEQRTR